MRRNKTIFQNEEKLYESRHAFTTVRKHGCFRAIFRKGEHNKYLFSNQYKMPYAKRYSKRYNKKYAPKRRTYKRVQSSGGKPGPEISCIKKLRYVDQISVNPYSLGNAQHHKFRANGCFDPDITGAGHQPMGFDQYMLFYNHFKVLGSKITVQGLSQASGTVENDQTIVSLSLDADTTTITDIRRQIELGLCSYQINNPGGSGRGVKLSKTFSMKKFFQNRADSDDTLIGNVAADPTEQAVYSLAVANLESADDAAPLAFLITIDYIVQFSEPKQLAMS